MTHLQLCSSVPASLLLFHSASPRATRRGTHWTEMIPNLSRSRTAEKMREKWNYVTRSHSSFGFSDILTLIIWQKSSVNRDCVELQSGCCDTPPPNFTQSCSLPFKTNTHCPSGPPSTTELTDENFSFRETHIWMMSANTFMLECLFVYQSLTRCSRMCYTANTLVYSQRVCSCENMCARPCTHPPLGRTL